MRFFRKFANTVSPGSIRLLLLASFLCHPVRLFSGELLRVSESPNRKYSVSIERVDSGEMRTVFKNAANSEEIEFSSLILFGDRLDPNEPVPEICWNPSSDFFVFERRTADGVSGKIVAFDELKATGSVTELKVPFAEKSEIVSYEFTKENGIRVTQRLASGRVAEALLTVQPSGSVHSVIER